METLRIGRFGRFELWITRRGYVPLAEKNFLQGCSDLMHPRKLERILNGETHPRFEDSNQNPPKMGANGVN